MSSVAKRNITLSIFTLAGLAVLIALSLASSRKKAVAAAPQPASPLFTPSPVASPNAPVTAPQSRPVVDAVFVLDTTGSMGGLIQGAKQKIWSIANQILSGQPRPDVRIGLVGYRDLGDDYVTRVFPLSEDMEDVYSNLSSFKAEGGGDTPEHVNKALYDAIHKMQWRDSGNALRLVFLVGDAPPHEGREGLTSSKIVADAASNGIILNTVRCGDATDTELAWKRLASKSGGIYTSIQQDGGMVAIATPMDGRLTELNAKLSGTLLPAGSEGARAEARRRVEINASMDGMAQAESAKFRAKSGKLDSYDLLTVLKKGKKLEAMPASELPPAMASMPKEEQKAFVEKVTREREEIQREITKVSKDRDAYIRSKAKPGGGKGLDDTIGVALKKQGSKIGIGY
jgi:hypothetical protein